MNKSYKEEEKVLNRKRKRNKQSSNLNNEKKIKSAETKKVNTLENMYEISNFMASINNKYIKSKFASSEKLKGKNLNIDHRKNKALKIINSISDKNNNELESLQNALQYDNTNKYIIYRLLKYYHDSDNKDKFEEVLNKYKFCITQKFTVVEKKEKIFIDLNNLYKVNTAIEEFEELPNREVRMKEITDLRNTLVDIFTNYYYISIIIGELRPIIEKNDLQDLLTIKYTVSDKDNNICHLSFEKERKEKIIEKYKNIKKNKEKGELLIFIENFLFKYLYYKEFMYFQNNQPISFKTNLTLFFNYIIYSLYELVIQVDEEKNQIFFKREKLYIYYGLRNFHDIIFDTYFDKKEPINEIVNYLLQFFLLSLSTSGKKSLFILTHFINLEKTKSFLDYESASKFITILNTNFGIKALLDKNKIIFDDIRIDKFEIEYENYCKEGLFYSNSSFNWLWNRIKFENFQTSNFFLESDIKYLKYLLKIILSSNLFKEIFINFNNLSEIADFYFDDPKNIDDYIERIIFLPFRADYLGKFAKTDRRLLSVLVSAFPEKEIIDLNQYPIYRLLELALRVIVLGYYESSQYIKSAYSIITEGKVSINTSNINKNIEEGFLLEEILFGFIYDEKNPLDLKKFRLSKTIKCKNNMIKNKKIDLVTALKILDPEIYSKNLNYFRKSIYEISKEDLKTFSFTKSNFDKTYENYLKSVLSEDKIKSSWNKEITINASMKLIDAIIVEYIRYNHNIK